MQVRTKEFREAYKLDMASNNFISLLNAIFSDEEKKNRIVIQITMNPEVFMLLRMLGRNHYSEATIEDVAKTGVFGQIWTADICVDSNVDGVEITKVTH